MPDYGFYRDDYLGTAIPEGQFPRLIQRASEVLEKFKRDYRVEGGQQAQNMALCAMAECLLRPRDPALQGATVGGVSVRYDTARSRQQQLYQAAGVYLEIYRGEAYA